MVLENAVTTGTILAEDGAKMSKSKKNYPDVKIIIDKYGVDSLRLYLMSSVVMKADNLNFSEKSVDDVRKNVLNIWWNIYVFCQATLTETNIKQLNTNSEILSLDHSSIHALDRWLLSKITSLTKSVTLSMDSYDVVTASRELMTFIKEFSTWYVRLSRNRIRSSANSQLIFRHCLRQYALLMAPFAPFMAERVYQGLGGTKDSIHLEDWPKYQTEGFENLELEQSMAEIMQIVEKAHGLRKAANIRLRQPLASLTISTHISSELSQIIADEINVKKILFGPSLALDTNLTPELIDEGTARDIIRDIQGERKRQGLVPSDNISVTLTDYPESWEAEIKKRVGATILVRGAEFSVEMSK